MGKKSSSELELFYLCILVCTHTAFSGRVAALESKLNETENVSSSPLVMPDIEKINLTTTTEESTSQKSMQEESELRTGEGHEIVDTYRWKPRDPYSQNPAFYKPCTDPLNCGFIRQSIKPTPLTYKRYGYKTLNESESSSGSIFRSQIKKPKGRIPIVKKKKINDYLATRKPFIAIPTTTITTIDPMKELSELLKSMSTPKPMMDHQTESEKDQISPFEFMMNEINKMSPKYPQKIITTTIPPTTTTTTLPPSTTTPTALESMMNDLKMQMRQVEGKFPEKESLLKIMMKNLKNMMEDEPQTTTKAPSAFEKMVMRMRGENSPTPFTVRPTASLPSLKEMKKISQNINKELADVGMGTLMGIMRDSRLPTTTTTTTTTTTSSYNKPFRSPIPHGDSSEELTDVDKLIMFMTGHKLMGDTKHSKFKGFEDGEENANDVKRLPRRPFRPFIPQPTPFTVRPNFKFRQTEKSSFSFYTPTTTTTPKPSTRHTYKPPFTVHYSSLPTTTYAPPIRSHTSFGAYRPYQKETTTYKPFVRFPVKHETSTQKRPFLNFPTQSPSTYRSYTNYQKKTAESQYIPEESTTPFTIWNTDQRRVRPHKPDFFSKSQNSTPLPTYFNMFSKSSTKPPKHPFFHSSPTSYTKKPFTVRPSVTPTPDVELKPMFDDGFGTGSFMETYLNQDSLDAYDDDDDVSSNPFQHMKPQSFSNPEPRDEQDLFKTHPFAGMNHEQKKKPEKFMGVIKNEYSGMNDRPNDLPDVRVIFNEMMNEIKMKEGELTQKDMQQVMEELAKKVAASKEISQAEKTNNFIEKKQFSVISSEEDDKFESIPQFSFNNKPEFLPASKVKFGETKFNLGRLPDRPKLNNVFRDLPGKIKHPEFPKAPKLPVPHPTTADFVSPYLKNPFGSDFVKLEIDQNKFENNHTNPGSFHVPLMVQAYEVHDAPPKVPNTKPLKKKIPNLSTLIKPVNNVKNALRPTNVLKKMKNILPMKNLLKDLGKIKLFNLPNAIQDLPSIMKGLVSNQGKFVGRSFDDNNENEDEESSLE